MQGSMAGVPAPDNRKRKKMNEPTIMVLLLIALIVIDFAFFSSNELPSPKWGRVESYRRWIKLPQVLIALWLLVYLIFN